MATVDERIAALENALKESEAKVTAVTVKLPPFWPDKAVLWFAQAEAQFLLRGITQDKTKFAHVMTMLDSSTAEHVMDVIQNPPENDSYGTLKTRLTGAYAITEDERAERLLNMNGLGDKTPSQCLSSMLMLVPSGQEPGFLFRRIFLRQLPVEVRTQLAQSTNTGNRAEDLRRLASEADRYFASAGARISSVSETSFVAEGPNSNASPQWNVDAVSGRQLCYFHRRFGKNAKKCEQPCSWTKTPSRLQATSTTTIPGNSQPGRN